MEKDIDAVQRNAASFHAEGAQTLTVVQQSAVRTDADYENASKYLLYVVGRRKEAEKMLDFFVRPLNEHIKRIRDIFRPAIAAYKDSEGLIRGHMNAYQNEMQRLREQAVREAEAAAGGGDAGAFSAALTVAQQPKPAGAPSRAVYKHRVTDASKVPAEFWVLDEKKLAKLARESKAQAQVPGVEFWIEQAVIAR